MQSFPQIPDNFERSPYLSQRNAIVGVNGANSRLRALVTYLVHNLQTYFFADAVAALL